MTAIAFRSPVAAATTSAPMPIPFDPPAPRSADEADWLNLADQGLLLVDIDGQVRRANQAAQAQLRTAPWAESPADAPEPRWHLRARSGALMDAVRGAILHRRHQLLALPGGAQGLVSVQPCEGHPDWAVINLGRAEFCNPLTLHFFAQSHQLTGKETEVLAHLLQGLRPAVIARRHGVLLSTVRTQILALRAKTRTDSTMALVHRVAMLPAMRQAGQGRVPAPSSAPVWDLH